ncbi:uncharacterized protein TRUGW13939_00922 [Talaromyces rugulosus]|uniref:Major facilitator superfamily (MFS) profile domain-containing protein n=1 Tax=Talaromyces rugulosus TaxID=121627 RepID=A0A7H8QJM3_TALRU|nr:uncharacterized protein TRUGW13939_00922 [Talaromyces rugulosus]QKX53842.1 hypothetical protein TRUGW13939_00922 [Talaromyces rugulosus]
MEHSAIPEEHLPADLNQIERNVSSQMERDRPLQHQIVGFEGPADPLHPHNWSLARRVWVTFTLALFNLIVTISSSIFGTAQNEVSKEFNVSRELTVLGTSLFLVGYIIGPLIFGPVSERFGRKYPLIAGVALSSLFGLMPALGQNLATIIIGRFFAGLFGVAPIAILGGVITDCWNPVHRGVALAFCICLVFSGPTFGPVIGGFIVASSLGWRWTMWVVVIVGLATSLLSLITYPETYGPRVLQVKARRMRKNTGDLSIHAPLDVEETSLKHLAQTYLIRPWVLFFNEPILILLTIYQSFIYGLMYLFYQSYPITFGEVRGWNPQLSTLPLLGIIIGVLIGTVVVVIYTQTYFRWKVEANNGHFEPEDRLPLMIFGGLLVPAGLFWYGWTSDPAIAWPSEVSTGILIGWGMYTIFIQCFTYIIDCYTGISNSAMAANGAVRSIFGAVFPLFATYLYHGLGTDWATSLIAFLSLAMTPVPAVFYYYGARIRARSKMV